MDSCAQQQQHQQKLFYLYLNINNNYIKRIIITIEISTVDKRGLCAFSGVLFISERQEKFKRNAKRLLFYSDAKRFQPLISRVRVPSLVLNMNF